MNIDNNKEERVKFVIVVRSDLNMSTGKIAAQVGHAVSQMMIEHIVNRDKDGLLMRWIQDNNQTKIVLKVDSEEELLGITLSNVFGALFGRYVRQYVVKDAGKTEVDPNTITCIGFGPNTDTNIDRLTGKLELLK